MNRIKAFILEAYQELRYKVSWPTWSELQSSTSVVFIAIAILSVMVFVMDFASSRLLDLFYGLF
ncbi:MAG: preprotein translocase subunit SecE [Chitinophagales bacterium]|nr:preprotein translocase subunit SecE [Chitinophagales bacterium]HAE13964.1 preprotein translocase subunit SecE [Bacteroidota bacterium]MCB9020790.1 preprotein translocase subunit SecE [Chitinophagales bacterium]MCB9031291.1 preprotein translocase subunit SecE [Chitinophagales bacterium]HAE35140.1 preprotein translocase subunit SecE [Bacteroidota bacterium]